MTYRPDIDGLRAIAVVSVILFHSGFDVVSGGYVGVDIFFVISGFLITKILHDDMVSGTYSLARFYERRIRRILPALLAVWLFCAVVGALLLLPGDLMDLGKALASSALFVSNIYFYKTSGYFDAPAHDKPLLHTWSLSVEEQFYIVWPLLMYVFVRHFRRVPLWMVLGGVSLISLVIAERWLIWDSSRAFYLLPARAWELSIGAFIAIYGRRIRPHRVTDEVMAVVGLVSILASLLLLKETSRFPGFSALPACIGTGLVILAGRYHKPVASQWLSTPLPVAVGLASYSLYLWHWPILVYWRHLVDRSLTSSETVVALVAIGLASFWSLRFIERPFRRSRISLGPANTGRQVLWRGGAITLVVSLAGIQIAHSKGWPFRFPDQVLAFEQQSNTFNPKESQCAGVDKAEKSNEACTFGSPWQADEGYHILIFGDSHASAFGPAIHAQTAALGLRGRQVTQHGCPPVLGVSVLKVGKESGPSTWCRRLQEQIVAMVDRNSGLRLVVLAARWDLYTEESRAPGEEGPPHFLSKDANGEWNAAISRQTLTDRLDATVRFFLQRDIKVLLVGGVPPLGRSALPCLARKHASDPGHLTCGPPKFEVMKRLSMSDNLIRRIADIDPRVWMLLPSQLLCVDARCRVTEDGTYLYSDDDHLNKFGAEFLGRHVRLSLLLNEPGYVPGSRAFE